MTEFTKGPWEVYTMKIGFPIIIHRKKAGLEVISKLIIDETSPNEAEQEANAHLIAASTRMYEVLEKIQGYLDADGILRPHSKAQEDINETLALARGEKETT